MTGSGDNFLPNLPPGLDEVDLLAWIEGDPLPRNREVAVARLLSDHPNLARRLDAMRRDRDVLRAMPADEKAPAGLLDGVQAALQPLVERQVLLGIQDGEPTEDHLPISLVVPQRRNVFDLLLRDRVGRKMALAAGLLLMVGGVTYFAAGLLTNSNRPSDRGRIAKSEGPEAAGTLAADDHGDMHIAAAGPAPGGEVPEESATMIAAGGQTDPLTPDATDPGEGAIRIAALEGEAEAAPMPIEEALRLAQDQRLVIRVRTVESPARPERIGTRLRTARAQGWRLAGEAPPTLAAALASPQFEAPVPALIRPGEFIAGPQLRGIMEGVLHGPPAPGVVSVPASTQSAVYLVQSRLDGASLEALRTSLRGWAAVADFEEVDGLEQLGLDASPSLAPSAVLWWGQPSTAWTRWTSVPVVVEPMR